jgi:hypothetical protein
MMNLGPMIFIMILIAISVIIPGEYGQANTLSSKESILIHEFVILPIWSLISFWGLYLAYKMVTYEFGKKKQKQEKNCDSSDSQQISISDKNSENSNDIEKEKLALRNSNPYLIKNSMNENSVIISVVSKKDENILKKKFTKEGLDSEKSEEEIRSSFEDMNGVVSNNDSKDSGIQN